MIQTKIMDALVVVCSWVIIVGAYLAKLNTDAIVKEMSVLGITVPLIVFSVLLGRNGRRHLGLLLLLLAECLIVLFERLSLVSHLGWANAIVLAYFATTLLLVGKFWDDASTNVNS